MSFGGASLRSFPLKWPRWLWRPGRWKNSVRAGVWRRTAWHVCLIGVAALVAAETSGVGRIVAARFTVQAEPPEVASNIRKHSRSRWNHPALPKSRSCSSLRQNRALRSPRANRGGRSILWLAGFAVVSLWAVFLRALFAIANRRRCGACRRRSCERGRSKWRRCSDYVDESKSSRSVGSARPLHLAS